MSPDPRTTAARVVAFSVIALLAVTGCATTGEQGRNLEIFLAAEGVRQFFVRPSAMGADDATAYVDFTYRIGGSAPQAPATCNVSLVGKKGVLPPAARVGFVLADAVRIELTGLRVLFADSDRKTVRYTSTLSLSDVAAVMESGSRGDRIELVVEISAGTVLRFLASPSFYERARAAYQSSFYGEAGSGGGKPR